MDPTQTSRRRFLASLGAGGVALGVGVRGDAAGAVRGVRAAAQAEGDEAADADAAAVIESLELAAAAFYDQTGRGGTVANPAAIAMLADFARHHREHAAAFAGIAGAKALGKPNTRLLQTFVDQLEQKQTEEEVLRLAYDLETAMTSTHLTSLGDVGDGDLVELLASVLPVEAQHATAAGRAAGFAASRAVPELENLDLALDVTQFPVTTTTTTAAP